MNLTGPDRPWPWPALTAPAHPFAEIGRTPARDRSISAARSVHLRREIGPSPHRDRSHSGSRSVEFPRVCCSPMVPRCGMWLSPSSSSCAPRRRVGRA